MENATTTTLLLVSLVTPIVVFWTLRARARMRASVAAAISVAAGWVLNVAWAFAVQATTANDAARVDDDPLAIAAGLGWLCPSLLVLLSWLALRFAPRRAARAE